MMKIIDRYVLKKFLTALGSTILSFTVIVFVVDFVEKGWSKMQRYDVSVSVMAQYYLNYLPFYMILAFPVAMLVSTLFSMGSLAKNRELDVMKASGLSLYRIAAPVLISGFILSIGVMLFGEFVLTETERRKDEINDYKIEKRTPVSRMTRHDVKVPGDNGWIVLARTYDIETKKALDVNVHHIVNDRILSTYAAGEMLYSSSGWLLINGSGQELGTDTSSANSNFVRFDTLKASFLTQTPDMMAELPLKPRQVNFFDLQKRIKQKKQLGMPTAKDQVELFLKLTFPFANFILVLIGAPLAANPRRSGPSVGFGISIIISFIFFVLIRIGQSFGNTGKLPPLLAASIGDIVFLLVGFVMLFKARK